MQVWRTVRAFGSVANWSAPVGLECITSDLLVCALDTHEFEGGQQHIVHGLTSHHAE